MGKVGRRSQPRSQIFAVKRLLNPVTLQYEDLGAPVGLATDSSLPIAASANGYAAPTTLLPLALGTYFFLTNLIITNGDTVAHAVQFEDGFGSVASTTPGTFKGSFIVSSGATVAFHINAGITFGEWYPANATTVAGATNAVAAWDTNGSSTNPIVTISGYLG